ncbi:hypothetical protein TNCV_765851 [Trichonephila clavipes]|nr:hypothetical protein TNCV_765851 [Trichonephila clavipes]
MKAMVKVSLLPSSIHGLVPTEAAHISSTIDHSPVFSNIASSVAQNKKRRVRGLGRGPPTINKLQSPLKKRKLKIIQCNVNGLCSRAMQVKLDQLRGLADSHGAQIIALQETNLRPDSQLKMRGFDVFRTDGPDSAGEGLAFLIRGVNYRSLSCQSNNPDLEIQGITLNWKNKPFNICNLYYPPNPRPLVNDISGISDELTVVLGDLNAKHTLWGCSEINKRGEDLLDFFDDWALLVLNDGTPTHSSFSYNTK